MKKNILITLLTLLVVVSGLDLFKNHHKENTSFNSNQWKEKGVDWMLKDTRENMLHDLLQNRIQTAQNKESIDELLGTPYKKEKNTYYYLIREKYESDIDPIYTKFLVIVFDDDKVIEYRTIKEN